MYTNGFKALEDEIRAAIKAKGIENNIVLHINSYRYYISICPDQKSDKYNYFGIQNCIDVPFNKDEHITRIYSSETLAYDLFNGIMVWFDKENLYYITSLKLVNSQHNKGFINNRTPKDYIPFIQSISVEKKPYTFFKNRKLIVKFAINKWQNLNNQYKELFLKQPEESIKNYNNFLYLQKKRKVDKKKREISKDFQV